MKRINNLYSKIYSLDNLILADKNARKGKSKQYGVICHRKNQEKNILLLHEILKNKTYKTSEYTTFIIREPKEREIYRLPYFPDRITHHAVMNILEPIFMSMFTADTYSCIKGKGISAGVRTMKKTLKNKEETTYCLKFDIKKFYPSIDHDILKDLLRRKFKDKDLLWLLDEIIESTEGVPIGNYLSQYFANFYLTGLDHWIKEQKQVKYYFRYADDIVILHSDKSYLHKLLSDIRLYLQLKLKLAIKENHQIFPVEARGIDFLGVVFRHDYCRLRKSIKKNFAKSVGKGKEVLAGYNGWLQYVDGINLKRKLLA